MDKSFTDKMGYKSLFGDNSSFSESSESATNPIVKTADKAVLQKINQEKAARGNFEAEAESYGQLGFTEKQIKAMYETDGHYSTVYLVCLMLGMKDKSAEQLAITTEAPDTSIHSPIKFELNDTWGYPNGDQQEIHALTGGFHGIEEFFTAIKFLYTPIADMEEIGKLLHRFGDCYAHTKIANLSPKDLKEDKKLKDANTLTIEKYIDSWKSIKEKSLKPTIEPWIKFFNYYMGKYGIKFLEFEDMQKNIFKGKTLKEVLKDIYLENESSDFIMYGEDGYTDDHFNSDGGFPDLIYLRPDWYKIYVKNLAWLISVKFKLNAAKLDMEVFDRMISFVSKDSCTMKGIIDFEIARKLRKKEVYIPVFYSGGLRLMANIDAVGVTDYLKNAQDVLKNTKKYILEQGVSIRSVEEVKGDILSTKFNKKGLFTTQAYKININ